MSSKSQFSILKFLKAEAASSVILFSCAILAMILANFGPTSAAYFQVLEAHVLGLTIHHWINDGLMAVFFFVVGMEIKREIVAGELSGWRQAALPCSAAIGGMIVPALFYVLFNSTPELAKGWAIPMATDIAFAVGVLSLVGRRVPTSLKIFLLALAIVDDLGAVAVIAAFFTNEIRGTGLVLTGVAVLGVLAGRRFRVAQYGFYLGTGILLWVGVLYSGIHATIAGVILGFLTPYRFTPRVGADAYSPLEDLVHRLHPYVTFGIMPIFALANAGVKFGDSDLSSMLLNEVSLGVGLGLFLGKPIGIMAASFLAVFFGVARLPEGVGWRNLFGVACLAGIGFTMSIFIASLSLPAASIDFAKFAILGASALSALVGYSLLKTGATAPK